MSYSRMHPTKIWHSPVPSNYNYEEPKQKSYWWLWLLPIVGILVFAYIYWQEDIDAFFKELFRNNQTDYKKTHP